MKIVIKNEFLNGLTQEAFIEQKKVNGWDTPIVFDLNEMFSESDIFKMAVSEVMPDIINLDQDDTSPNTAEAGYDVYCWMKIAKELDDELMGVWKIYTYNEHQESELEDVLAVITATAHGLVSFAEKSFEIAKTAIVSKTVNFTLDGDMNSLDFDSLVQYGANIDKEYISDTGDITVQYCDNYPSWKSEEGFEFDIGDYGVPVNNTPEESFELDNGAFVLVKSFSEKVR